MASHALGNLRSTLLLTALLALAGLAGSLQPAAAQDAAAPAPPPLAASTIEPGSIKDTTIQTRKQMVSFFTGVNFHFVGYGFPLLLSGRYYFPIVPNGFLPTVNDEFGIEGGLDLMFLFGSTTYLGFGVPVDAVWDFHISERFDAYAKVGFTLGSTFSYGGLWFDPHTLVGMRLKLNEALYFRAEAGYPVIMAGLGFAF